MNKLRSFALAAMSVDYLLLASLLAILAFATLQMLGDDTFRLTPLP